MAELVPLRNRRIVITGSTGMVGLPVTRALAAENEVWALARFTQPGIRAQLEALGVHCVTCDLVAGDFTGVPRDVDHVFNFARPNDRATGMNFDRAITEHAESIGLLMAHCSSAASVLHCSSTSQYLRGVNPSRETDALTDDRHPTRPTYTLGKICAEAVARAAARIFGIPTLIARLNVPYSDEGGWPAQHLDALAAGVPIAVNVNQPNAFNPIHVDDMIRTIPALLAAASVPATIVNWAGVDTVSIEEWSEYLGELIGRRPQFTLSSTATETMRVDTTLLTELTGAMTVDWRSGMRRLVATRHPQLLADRA